ncbi:MAG: hypothetical protein A2734_00215 [Parcubacteria group bacterium RIFCSPHIGHO2_01_FULL_40_30]|nr:MAG: hypothetical protein A2734_00215 [Parcubacteria group bacterium RIFCSPHIGHO2_01_FULL_40_30]OHB22498.1 MAG: hypothetical protein A3I22_02780 [Parcubacteria group bacterium RIFCSPLOWO2_02_FULL_40_12]
MIYRANYAASVRVENETIPVIKLWYLFGGFHRGRGFGSIVIIYGGSKNENLRMVVANSLGVRLVDLGFNVYCFDFRSNLDASRFDEFGLYDRLEDAREVVKWILDSTRSPVSLMGVSMGGPLAVAIASEFGCKIKNLFLVAPAAYTHKAMKPEVKFGPRFRKIIRKPESWHETASFKEARKVSASTLVIKFDKDKVVPDEIPTAYFQNIGQETELGSLHVELKSLEGPHSGTFTNSQRQKDIIRAIREFLALPPMARD